MERYFHIGVSHIGYKKQKKKRGGYADKLIVLRCNYFAAVVYLVANLSLISVHSDYLFKLLLIGDSGVGKSCLLLRFAVCTISSVLWLSFVKVGAFNDQNASRFRRKYKRNTDRSYRYP